VVDLISGVAKHQPELARIAAILASTADAQRREVFTAVRKAIRLSASFNSPERNELLAWYKQQAKANHNRYNSKLHTDGKESPDMIAVVNAAYDEQKWSTAGKCLMPALTKTLPAIRV
jgi:hypothetical protein